MSELIRIGAPEGADGKQGLGATIDTTGAWVTELSIGKDHILFPRDLVPVNNEELKLRGGMHVCSPYFGADEDGPQHGFARTALWVPEKRAASELILSHQCGLEGSRYEGLEQRIQYLVAGRYFTALLNLANHSGKVMEIAPGFHPYFAGPDSRNLANPEPILEGPQGAGILAGSSSRRVVKLNGSLEVVMSGERMPGIVRWSDKPDEYHCLEPVASEFRDGKVGRTELEPGEARSYVLSLEVNERSLEAEEHPS